jgi:site-specific DNA recombinase
MTNVAIYARVSSERQQEERTIESQLAELREASARAHVIGEYLDDGYSGEILARPGLDRLRDDARKGTFAAVYVHSPDRLARKYAYQVLVIEELRKCGIEVTFLNKPLGDTPEDSLLLGVQGLIAEYEKTKILERTRRGKLQKARNGFVVGSIPPYGYRYFRAEGERYGRYLVNETEAATVRLIFDLYGHTGSVREVVRQLTARGISPRHGHHWRTSTLHRIVRNETYCGTTYYNKYYAVETQTAIRKYSRRLKAGRRLRPRDQWVRISVPALITRSQFDAVQTLLNNQHRPASHSRVIYLLGGLVRCAACGASFTGEKCKGHYYYRCNNRHRRFPLPRSCSARTVVKYRLETAVWNCIVKAVSRPDLLLEHVRHLYDGLEQTTEAINQQVAGIRHQLDRLKDQQQRLLDLFMEASVDKDALCAKSQDLTEHEAQLQKDLRDAERKLTQMNTRAAAPPAIERFCVLARQRIHELTDPEKALFLHQILKEVRFDSRRGIAQLIGAIPPCPEGTPFDPDLDAPREGDTVAEARNGDAITSTDAPGMLSPSSRYCGRNPRSPEPKIVLASRLQRQKPRPDARRHAPSLFSLLARPNTPTADEEESAEFRVDLAV